jgi:peptidylprolyl isomerase
VATSKRERQKAGHHARLNAERAAWSRYRRRRRLTLGALIVAGLLAAGVLVLVLSRSGDDTSVATATTTTASTSPTSTATPLESAAGKPCVALADPLPEGAPEVPVPVGAPPTELVVEDLVVGSGTPAALGDEISVNYIGVSCSTGKIFDSSYSRGQPSPFSLSGVIKGWTDGIPGMQVGGQRLLGIPAAQGYGAQGSPPDIAPDETLWFVVEIVETKAG